MAGAPRGGYFPFVSNVYLAAADTGRNSWLRYLAGLVSLLVIWQIGGVAVTAGLLGEGAFEPGWQAPPLGFALSLLSFLPLLLGTWFVNRAIHKRSVKSLTTGHPKVRLRRVWIGFWGWLLVSTVLALVEAIAFPGRYSLNPEPAAFLPYLLIALVFIGVQTSAEEYLFRGYLLQGVGRLLKSPILLSVINGLLFALPHLPNPEAQEIGALSSMLGYGAIGFLLAYLTLYSGGLELALGIHAANNLFAVVVGYRDNAFGITPLVVNSVIDPWLATGSVLLVTVTVLALTRNPSVRRWIVPELGEARA